MDLLTQKLRDKRNRQLERESNLLKDELCTMRHLIHLLDNIKRVSRDCISHLHLMVDAAVGNDPETIDQLRDDVQELEDELKEWEKKYHVMNTMQTKSVPMSVSVIHHNTKPVVNDRDDRDDSVEINGSFEHKSERSNASIIPQELCEISMETYDNDNENGDGDESPDMMNHTNHHSNSNDENRSAINCTPNSPQPISISSSSSGVSMSAYSNMSMLKHRITSSGQFGCDWSGCSFKTNVRQRLVMHKRLHAGELLFSCDVPGCDYQSNYKGNIKIHKKHRHKEGDDSLVGTDTSTLPVAAQSASQSESLVVEQSQRQPSMVLSQLHDKYSSILPKRRRRRKRFRLTMRGPISGMNVNDGTIFACDVKGCKYHTKWKQCLTAHQLLHAGVKPYKCDYPGCNYSTNFKGNVNVHKRVHRTSTSNEIYKCPAPGCDFSTPWKNSFNLHQRNHFEVVNGDADGSNSNLELDASMQFTSNIEDDGDDDEDDDVDDDDAEMHNPPDHTILNDSQEQHNSNGTNDSHQQNPHQIYSNQMTVPTNHTYTSPHIQAPLLIKTEIPPFAEFS